MFCHRPGKSFCASDVATVSKVMSTRQEMSISPGCGVDVVEKKMERVETRSQAPSSGSDPSQMTPSGNSTIMQSSMLQLTCRMVQSIREEQQHCHLINHCNPIFDNSPWRSHQSTQARSGLLLPTQKRCTLSSSVCLTHVSLICPSTCADATMAVLDYVCPVCSIRASF